MEISHEEIKHIANLANLNIKEEELDEYSKNLEDILNFANIINKANVDDLKEAIGVNEKCNEFRKDEVKEFEDNQALFDIAIEEENHMFKIPKVIN